MIHDRTAHYVECPRCMGYGDEPGAPTDPDGTAPCLTCGGTGSLHEGKMVARSSIGRAGAKGRRVRIFPIVDGADLVTGAIGRGHLRRHGKWTARRCVEEHAAWRLARHQRGEPKAV